MLYDPVKNGLAPVLNKIIEMQESKGLFTFYMTKTSNPGRLNQQRVRNLMFDVGCPKLKNYDITVEEIVPAGQKSKYHFHFAYQLWTHKF